MRAGCDSGWGRFPPLREVPSSFPGRVADGRTVVEHESMKRKREANEIHLGEPSAR
jgi:hypothetical protein